MPLEYSWYAKTHPMCQTDLHTIRYLHPACNTWNDTRDTTTVNIIEYQHILRVVERWLTQLGTWLKYTTPLPKTPPFQLIVRAEREQASSSDILRKQIDRPGRMCRSLSGKRQAMTVKKWRLLMILKENKQPNWRSPHWSQSKTLQPSETCTACINKSRKWLWKLCQ